MNGIFSERIAVHFAHMHEVAGMLQQLFKLHSPAEPTDVRAIMVDDATGELIVVANKAGYARVRQMLSPGLSPPPDAERIELVSLKNAEARAVAHTLRPFVSARARVVVDEQTNQLVISGPPNKRAELLALARALDQPEKR